MKFNLGMLSPISEQRMDLQFNIKHSTNNFDALRLLGALLVSWSHSLHFIAGGDPLGAATGNQSLGGLGLNLFCVISGYLITRSRKRNSLMIFIRARALRLIPALAAATFIFAFFLGPLVTRSNLAEYFESKETYYFLGTVFVIPLNQTLPGVFNGISLNGALYSLTVEVIFYFFVGALGGRRWYPIICTIAFIAVCTVFIFNSYVTLPFSKIWHIEENGLTLFFYPVRLGTLCLYYLLAGSLLAIVEIDQAMLRRCLPAMIAIWLMAFFSTERRVYDVIEMVLFPLIVLGIGKENQFTLDVNSRLGDISYGTYIYHTVVIHLILYMQLLGDPKVLVAIAIVWSCVLGWLSFHLIEKRFLKNAIRVTTRDS